MCGRYRLSRRKQIIEEYFDTAPWDDDWSPRFNIAPTQPVPVIRQHPTEPVRQATTMRWGLIPMGKRTFDCDGYDQREIGDGSFQARISRSAEIPQMSDPRRWLL